MGLKVGDKVRIIAAPHIDKGHSYDDIGTVVSLTGGIDSRHWPLLVSVEGKDDGSYRESELKLVESKENATMGRRTFRLLKDTPDLKKGTLFQEACDDGDQEYVVLNIKDSFIFDDWNKYFQNPKSSHSRDTVEKQPQWFEEVFQPQTKEWLTAEELQRWNDFNSNKRTTPKKATKTDNVLISKYAWLHNMKKDETKRFKSDEYGRTVASAYYHAERYGKKFKFTKIDETTSKVKRIK